MSKLNLDPTGHLAAQFPELSDIMERMAAEQAPANRSIEIKWRNGMIFYGRMRAATAERFAREAMESPLVASVRVQTVLHLLPNVNCPAAG